jgi:hypothetical protein
MGTPLGAGSAAVGGSSGYGSSSTTAGPHSSNLANKADPRVDSDRDGSGFGNTGSSNTGVYSSTSSSTTAGPHSSNLANKADPRVDSEMVTPAATLVSTALPPTTHSLPDLQIPAQLHPQPTTPLVSVVSAVSTLRDQQVITPHPRDITPHPRDITPHPRDITPHPRDIMALAQVVTSPHMAALEVTPASQ